ncbi:MAG: hypothetical protein ACTSW1_16655 [Candidatus Hodarchaeales archaeon]
MSGKNLKITCVWRSDEFVISDSINGPSRDEATLTIDESLELIRANIPSKYSLITKKIIERRVHAIAKTGFSLPKSQIRAGAGFKVVISKEDKIPEVLLQEGHKYTYDLFGAPKQTEVKPVEKKETLVKPSETEYVPSFIKVEAEASGSSEHLPLKIISELQEEKPEAEAGEPTPVKEPMTFSYEDKVIAGLFILELAKLGDVYLKLEESQFSVEYPPGRVEFTLDNGEIKILQTNRVTADDPFLISAIQTAKGKNA